MRRLALLCGWCVACGSSPVDGPDAGAEVDAFAADDAAIEDASTPDAGPADDAGFDPAFAGRYPLTAQFPEGGTYDDSERAFFVGSLGTGDVFRIDAETGEETLFYEATDPGLYWTLGLDVDEARGRLVVCAMEDLREVGDGDPANAGYVWSLDLETGERLSVHALGDAFETATCTDVAVAADGTIYVCDREHPNVYRIDPEGTLSMFVSDDLLAGGVVGQNALVLLPDESALLSLVYLSSRLVYIRLDDGAVREVEIDGDFADRTPVLSGADGMTYVDGGLLVAFTSQFNRVTPVLADWSQATTVAIDVPEGMTDVVATPGGNYLLNGQAVHFAFDRTPEPFALVRFEGRFE